jgi:hypothetical protein
LRAGAILGAVTAWFAVTAPFAHAVITCNAGNLAQPYAPFIYQPHDPGDPETVCKAMLTSRCSTMPDAQGQNVSACKLIVEEMKAAALEYQTHVDARYCNGLQSLYSTCPATPGGLFPCHQREDQQHVQAETGILNVLNPRKAAIRSWKRQIALMKQKFSADLLPGSSHFTCATNSANVAIPAASYADLVHLPATDSGSLAAQLAALTSRVNQFETAIHASVTRHTSQRASFQTMATAASRSARNVGSVAGPTAATKPHGDPKSDITGTEKEQGAQQSPQQGGGGGSPGGGGAPSGGGSPSENALASGTGPGEAGGPQPQVAAHGHGDTGADGARNTSGGSTAAKAIKIETEKGAPTATPTYSTGGPSLTAGFGASAPAQNSSLGASSAQPNRASASGGGGGASAGGGGSLAAPCSGKDCQAATGAGMFGGIGALGSGSASGGGDSGGGLAGLGGLDAGGSLDNLFKDDKPQSGSAGAGSLEGMANLDSSTAGLEAGAADAAAAAQAGGDIGTADGDLFTRLHEFHVRAQKSGRVVGMTRKL